VKNFCGLLALVLPVLMLSGCVTSYYKNEKGDECKRRYLTTLGIAMSSCGEAVVTTVPAMAAGSGGISAQQTQGGPIVSGRDSGVSVQPIVTPTFTAPSETEENMPEPTPSKDLPMGPIATLGG
jgi:hypothetical protein